MSYLQLDFVDGPQNLVAEYQARIPCDTIEENGLHYLECVSAYWINVFEALDGTICFTEWYFGDWYVVICAEFEKQVTFDD